MAAPVSWEPDEARVSRPFLRLGVGRRGRQSGKERRAEQPCHRHTAEARKKVLRHGLSPPEAPQSDISTNQLCIYFARVRKKDLEAPTSNGRRGARHHHGGGTIRKMGRARMLRNSVHCGKRYALGFRTFEYVTGGGGSRGTNGQAGARSRPFLAPVCSRTNFSGALGGICQSIRSRQCADEPKWASPLRS
jgi:hypothetical protein